jgi:putative transposase
MIISTVHCPLSGILGDFKKYTASAIAKELKSWYESRSGWILDLFGEVAEGLERVRNYKVWQDGNHPEILYKKKFINQKLEYLHYNPVMDEIVSRPEDYLYSSARDYYCNEIGLLELDFT